MVVFMMGGGGVSKDLELGGLAGWGRGSESKQTKHSSETPAVTRELHKCGREVLQREAAVESSRSITESSVRTSTVFMNHKPLVDANKRRARPELKMSDGVRQKTRQTLPSMLKQEMTTCYPPAPPHHHHHHRVIYVDRGNCSVLC